MYPRPCTLTRCTAVSTIPTRSSGRPTASPPARIALITGSLRRRPGQLSSEQGGDRAETKAAECAPGGRLLKVDAKSALRVEDNLHLARPIPPRRRAAVRAAAAAATVIGAAPAAALLPAVVRRHLLERVAEEGFVVHGALRERAPRLRALLEVEVRLQRADLARRLRRGARLRQHQLGRRRVADCGRR